MTEPGPRDRPLVSLHRQGMKHQGEGPADNIAITKLSPWRAVWDVRRFSDTEPGRLDAVYQGTVVVGPIVAVLALASWAWAWIG